MLILTEIKLVNPGRFPISKKLKEIEQWVKYNEVRIKDLHIYWQVDDSTLEMYARARFGNKDELLLFKLRFC